MKITLTQIIMEKAERCKIKYEAESSWIPSVGSVVKTGNHAVKVLSIDAQLSEGNVFIPVVRCKMGDRMDILDHATTDGWVEVDDEDRVEI